MGQLLKLKSLTKNQLDDIRGLENACSSFERLNMKLNWDMLETRASQEINDFLYYKNGRLEGFLGMYGFGRKEIEITGMIHPAARQKGIFSQLFDDAKAECAARGIGKLLLITERTSKAGAAFAESVGGIYGYSEYRMKFEASQIPVCKEHGIVVRKPEPGEIKQFAMMDAENFGVVIEETNDGSKVNEASRDSNEPAEENVQSYMDGSTLAAVLDGELIGKIGMIEDGGSRYIFGFVIKPEHRGKGYGREVLNKTVRKAFLESKGAADILLEVSVENERALNLYKSCGFSVITVYDYYTVSNEISAGTLPAAR